MISEDQYTERLDNPSHQRIERAVLELRRAFDRDRDYGRDDPAIEQLRAGAKLHYKLRKRERREQAA